LHGFGAASVGELLTTTSLVIRSQVHRREIWLAAIGKTADSSRENTRFGMTIPLLDCQTAPTAARRSVGAPAIACVIFDDVFAVI
jgi:hypothetical protein